MEVSHCVNYINVQQKDLEGRVITDSNGNEVLSQVMIVTNAEDYEIANELRRIKPELRRTRDRSFSNIKNCYLV